jgi:hypothetical protein
MRRSVRSLASFLGHQFSQIAHMAPAFGGTTLGQFEVLLEERWEAQRLQS